MLARCAALFRGLYRGKRDVFAFAAERRNQLALRASLLRHSAYVAIKFGKKM